MTYDAFEVSAEQSTPVELYEIRLGSLVFRYTSAEQAQVIGGVTFEPLAITRSRTKNSREDRNNQLNVTVPSSNEFARFYINTVPGETATLEIMRFQALDTPTPQVITIFRGLVRSVSFSEDGLFGNIASVPETSAISRAAPRITYQSLCNHVLFDDQCQVDPTAGFQATLTITAVNGAEATIPGMAAFGTGFFNGGFVEVVSQFDARQILFQTGDVAALLQPFPFNAVGIQVVVKAGCDHSQVDCNLKFSNGDRYGGFPFVPIKNIFVTGLI